MLREFAEKISDSDKAKVETAVKAVKDALSGNDQAAIRSMTEKLNETWQAVSTELYKAAAQKAEGAKAAGGPGGPDAGAKPAEGPIIDAEVVEEQKPK